MSVMFGDPTRVSVTVKDLVYTSNEHAWIPGCLRAWWDPPRSRLLENVSFFARPGELLMILGSSGSSKTTLLNVLADRVPVSHVEGQVRFNGQQTTRQGVRSFLCYVMQRDVLPKHLTVFETFDIAAQLKLPQLGKLQRLKRIETILTSMSLHHCRDSKIGDESTKGVSVSELKRVTIGIELLSCPSVLLCDEPTSSLDSNMSIRLMSCLMQQAKQGTTVIITIHQPCSQVFNMCDRFLLLAQGRVAYFGTPLEAKAHLSLMGVKNIPSWNISDSYIFLLSLFHNAYSYSGAPKSLDEQDAMSSQEDMLRHSRIRTYEDIFHFWNTSHEKKRMIEEIDTINCAHRVTPLPVHPWSSSLWSTLQIVYTLQKRFFKNTKNNGLIFLIIFCIHILQALIFGFIFFNLLTHQRRDNSHQLIPRDLWHESEWFRELVSTSSPNPFAVGFTPFLDVYHSGVDRNGSFFFFSASSSVEDIKARIHYGLNKVVTCLYNTYRLNERYPSLATNLNNVSSSWDTWVPTQIYANLMALYQLLDYWMGDAPWKKKIHLQDFFDPNCQNVYCQQKVAAQFFQEVMKCLDLPAIVPTSPLANTASLNLIDSVFNASHPQTPPHHDGLAYNAWSIQHCKQRFRLFQQSRLHYSASHKQLWDIGGQTMESIVEVFYMWLCRLSTCKLPFCVAIDNTLKAIDTWKDALFMSMSDTVHISGCILLLVTFVGFSSYQCMLTFPQERLMFNRETANGLYPPLSYYIAKNVADLPLQILPCIFMALLFFVFVDFHISFSQFLTYVFLIALTAFTANGFAYIISAVSRRLNIAVFIGPLTLGLLLVLGGFFVRDHDIPRYIRWLKVFSFYRWAYSSLIINQFPPGQFLYIYPNDLIRYAVRVTTPSLLMATLYLFCLGIFYRILAFYLLVYTNRDIGLLS